MSSTFRDHYPISSSILIGTNLTGKTMESLWVQKDTVTNRLPTEPPLKAHLGIKAASSRADSELVADEDSDHKETTIQESEGVSNQSCASPTTDTDSEGEGIDFKSCLDVHCERRDGVHGVLVHDKKGETPVGGQRRKRVCLNELQLQISCSLPPTTTTTIRYRHQFK